MHMLLLLLLSRFSHVQLCATPQTAAHQAPPSLGFSRQEHWSGLSFPSPMHKATLFSFVRFQLKYPPLTEIILDHLFRLITIIGEQINSYCNDLNTIGSYFRSYFTSIENLRQSCRLQPGKESLSHTLIQEPRLIGALPLLTCDFQDCSSHSDNWCDPPAQDKKQKSLKTL